MSDAGRKMDVEDVLSSIRRLVSEEARTVAEKETFGKNVVNQEQAPREPVIEKLVLTPAFRVSEQHVENSETAEFETQSAPDVFPEAMEIPQAPIAQEEFQPIEPGIQPIAETAPIEEAPFEDVIPDDPTPTEEPFHTEAIADFEPEMLEPLEMPEPTIAFSAPFEEVTSDPEIEAVKDEEKAAPEPDAAAQPAPESVASADGDTEMDYTADTDTYLDEEALRELVSEMVRSELQGELGDRITRNVRKLVRREIHRALASRDFD